MIDNFLLALLTGLMVFLVINHIIQRYEDKEKESYKRARLRT